MPSDVPSDMPSDTDIKESVRRRYAEAAHGVLEANAGCCGPTTSEAVSFGKHLYEGTETETLPEDARLASLGCGNPTAVADLNPGDVVLDLGSGGGLDVLLSAQRVGPTGKVFGLDMTDEMLVLARKNQAEAGVSNAEFLKGEIESIPLPDASVDVVISNCVINLSADKSKVFAETHRVLRPGGRFAVTDVVTGRPFTETEKADMASWTGCVAGALTKSDYAAGLERAGFSNIEIEVINDIGGDILSAIVRARA